MFNDDYCKNGSGFLSIKSQKIGKNSIEKERKKLKIPIVNLKARKYLKLCLWG